MNKNQDDYPDSKKQMIHADVGMSLQLQFSRELAHLKTTLVGIEPDQYLIVQTPKFEGIDAYLHIGQPVVVRFVYSGTIYGFASSVLDSVIQPSRLLFLSYPDSMEKRELREGMRVECYLPTLVNFAEPERKYKGIILDISAGGCNVTIKTNEELLQHPIHIEEEIQLIFQLLGIEGSHLFLGEVRSTRQDNEKSILGVKFGNNNSADLLNKIDAYVKKVGEFL